MTTPSLPPVEKGVGTYRCGPVILRMRTDNAKLGPVVTTWVGIKVSCPTTCAQHPDNGGGCYADAGMVGYRIRRMDAAFSHLSPSQVAMCEARAIDALHQRRGGRLHPRLLGRPMRLHSSGDCRTPSAARILGAACERYHRAGGGPVWTYTHAWREVPRSAWGDHVAVVASVDSEADIPAARAQGYRLVARIVNEHTDARAIATTHGREIPCPSQTRGRTCAECRLCFRERDAVVTFAAHGPRTRHALEVLQ